MTDEPGRPAEPGRDHEPAANEPTAEAALGLTEATLEALLFVAERPLARREIAQRADVIRAALRDADSVVLQDLLRGVRDRVVVVITFLALLELMKRREIVVEQAEPWGPIVARAMSAEERAAAGLAPTVDDVPIDEALDSFA